MAITGPDYYEHHAICFQETAFLDEQLRDTETLRQVARCFALPLKMWLIWPAIWSIAQVMLQRSLCRQNSFLNNDNDKNEIKHVSWCVRGGGGH